MSVLIIFHTLFITVWSDERHAVSNQHQLNSLFSSSLTVTNKMIKAQYYLHFVREIHWWPMDSPHKGPVMQNSFHIMTSSCCFSVPLPVGAVWPVRGRLLPRNEVFELHRRVVSEGRGTLYVRATEIRTIHIVAACTEHPWSSSTYSYLTLRSDPGYLDEKILSILSPGVALSYDTRHENTLE